MNFIPLLGRVFQKKETRYIQILIIHISETLNCITPNAFISYSRRVFQKRRHCQDDDKNPDFPLFPVRAGASESVCVFLPVDTAICTSQTRWRQKSTVLPMAKGKTRKRKMKIRVKKNRPQQYAKGAVRPPFP